MTERTIKVSKDQHGLGTRLESKFGTVIYIPDEEVTEVIDEIVELN